MSFNKFFLEFNVYFFFQKSLSLKALASLFRLILTNLSESWSAERHLLAFVF